jgi:NapC/NirT cytochrome c family, N-terminal region
MLEKTRSWLVPLVYLSDNWISLTGVVLVTTCTVFWLFLLPVMLSGGPGNPYLGILVFMLLPGSFFLSLFLIPLGIVLKRRRQGKATKEILKAPVTLDFRRVEVRRLALFIVLTTFVNILIASQLSYGAVSYMETVQFCGQTCHTVMKPEYTAYQNSPHSRVECVKCHIGPGASWFVRSKLSGVRQVFAVTFHTYSTPIPTPVRNLRPARDTCEACHWPDRFGGDRLKILPKFAGDENNTASKTVLLMHIGGGNGKGIHGVHVGPGITIQYASDESRQKIPWVSYQKGSSAPVTYTAEGFKQDNLKTLATRVMDCMDCHNRPAHTFELPERAVDGALASGAISPALPWAKKQAIAILRAKYSTSDEAEGKIPAAFEAFYKQNYPAIYSERTAEVKRSAKAVLAVFNRNIFPEMKVTWGSYPNNLGHTDMMNPANESFIGCFRCHDDGHTATGGLKITQDCSACHAMLATDEKSPKVLTDLGVIAETLPPDMTAKMAANNIKQNERNHIPGTAAAVR